MWSAKFLGHLFSFGTFFFCFRIVVQITQSPLFGVLTTVFLALNTSFVVWNVSGLENALYAFEVAALVYLCLLTLDRINWRAAIGAGLLAAAATLTRPDGIIFASLWPLALAVHLVRNRELSSSYFNACVSYIAAFALPVIAYKAMAVSYFGSLFPNTYYAKGGLGFDTFLRLLSLDEQLLTKGLDLLSGPFGFAWATLALFLIALAMCLFAKRLGASLIFMGGATILALAIFILLPFDWMPEFRFGTPFLVLPYPTLFSLIWVAGDSVPNLRFINRDVPALIIVAALAVPAVFLHQIRLARFYDDPTVPFSLIADRFGERFNRAADILGVEHASFLVPDLGGTLFYSELEVYDLSGLTDPTIARTLRKDKKSLHDYIFTEVKPTFIRTHKNWAAWSDLDSSAQFREQYMAIREAIDPNASAIAGREIYSGDYVRKDVVDGRPEALSQVRAALYESPKK